jgi:hypothetical protein
MEKLQQWWNGRWGRLARVDVVLFSDENRWIVEHRIGGVEGRSTSSTFDSEQAALDQVGVLLTGSDGWREL